MGKSRKRKGDAIDGVLILDKPSGITSNKALQQCRYMINAQKGGHTGALDPLATGLLPLCFGQATKISSFMLGKDKTYLVGVKLGQITDTGDADGKVIESSDVKVSKQQVKDVLRSFVGQYDQVPPMYSALKVNGQPLYKLARKGIIIEREARKVTAHEIKLLELNQAHLSFEVSCSSGFYVRSLVEDVGNKLGCGAHVKTLRRTRIDTITLDSAISLEAFTELDSVEKQKQLLIPADQLIQFMPKVSVDATQKTALQFGQPVADLNLPETTDEDWIRIYDDEQIFIGLGKVDKDQQLHPKRLFISAA